MSAANKVTGRVRRSVPPARLGGAGGHRPVRVPVDRASSADLMQLAADVGPAPMHDGAVLAAALRQELPPHTRLITSLKQRSDQTT